MVGAQVAGAVRLVTSGARLLMLIGTDAGAVPQELLCLGFKQLTCRGDCLTFSGRLRPSTLI